MLKALFLLTGYVVVLLSQTELEEGGYYQGEYYVLLLCSVLGMVMMSSARDLISVFIALELLSIPAYMIAAWRKRDPKSNEAGVKYYLLGVFASAVLLYGMSLLYGATGTTKLIAIGTYLAGHSLIGLDIVGVVFVIVGFAFKISAVPFHTWAPDTYEGAPTPVTAFLSVASKAAGFVALILMVFLAFPTAERGLRPARLGARGADDDGRQRDRPAPDEHRAHARLLERQPGRLHPDAAGIRQHRRRRRHGAESGRRVPHHLRLHQPRRLRRGHRRGPQDPQRRDLLVRRAVQYAPGLAVMMTLFLASLAGIPPLGGWIAKFGAFKTLLDAGTGSAYILAVIGAVNTVIASAYYVRVMREMWMKRPAGRRPVTDRHAATNLRGAGDHHRRHDRRRRAARAGDALRRPAGPQRRARRLMAGGAAGDIRAAIEAAGGAIPFSAFVELALYGHYGFYAHHTAGRRGDFLTSPEVGPLFGAVFARFLDAEWDRIGRPDPFTVVDAGAGPGTLARSVLAARSRCSPALQYVAVEVSAAQRACHPAGVSSTAVMPADPIDGVVIANEVLDNLPFRLAVHDGAWREAFVVDDGGSFAEVLSAPFDPVPAVLPAHAAHGARAPLQDAAAAWLSRACGVVRRGSVVVLDYARATTSELASMRWRAWLRTYRGHARGTHPLADPGDQDITVDVAIDQLAAPSAIETQAEFLRRWGIDELVAEGRRAWDAAASAPNLAAMAMRSRSREAEALLDPSGLGGFSVLRWDVLRR